MKQDRAQQEVARFADEIRVTAWRPAFRAEAARQTRPSSVALRSPSTRAKLRIIQVLNQMSRARIVRGQYRLKPALQERHGNLWAGRQVPDRLQYSGSVLVGQVIPAALQLCCGER